MHAFDVLGDAVRRRIVELIADRELASGAIARVVQAEFGISQPAVSQHLRVLRDSGFVTVRPQGTRRLYAVEPELPRHVDEWLGRFRSHPEQAAEPSPTELDRERRERRVHAAQRILL